MKIYEGNSKSWDFLIINLTDIPFLWSGSVMRMHIMHGRR